MDSLADLIRRNHAAVMLRWKERVRGSLDPTHADGYELEDRLPAFLDELAEKLAHTGMSLESSPATSSELAEEHGRQRFRSGMNLASVILEYGVLEECILDLLTAQSEQRISVGQFRTLARLLNAGVADASREFMRQRDAEIQRQAAEHLAFLAHEIRNPLGSLSLSVGVLERTKAVADERVTHRMGRALERLQRILDETILHVRTKALGAQLALRPERFRLHELVSEIAEECSYDAAAHGISLVSDGVAAIEVDADRRLMRSVLSNLVRNAIKFTGHGGHIRIYAASANGRISIEVEDECGGLPEGSTEELFLPFRKGSRDHDGFGLGLAIAKQAVEAHSGSLQVRNLPGRGCVFMVDLPAPARE